MSRFVPVARVEEIPPGSRLHYDLTEDTVIILNIDGDYYCIADLCTHDGGPLEDGDILDHQIECPRHGARFDVRTGKVTRLPATDPIPTYSLKVEDGLIFVEEPEPW
jgi:3-phenylpropionate/trans-cinnamate dioxygenase ferredoxin subunit